MDMEPAGVCPAAEWNAPGWTRIPTPVCALARNDTGECESLFDNPFFRLSKAAACAKVVGEIF